MSPISNKNGIIGEVLSRLRDRKSLAEAFKDPRPAILAPPQGSLTPRAPSCSPLTDPSRTPDGENAMEADPTSLLSRHETSGWPPQGTHGSEIDPGAPSIASTPTWRQSHTPDAMEVDPADSPRPASPASLAEDDIAMELDTPQEDQNPSKSPTPPPSSKQVPMLEDTTAMELETLQQAQDLKSTRPLPPSTPVPPPKDPTATESETSQQVQNPKSRTPLPPSTSMPLAEDSTAMELEAPQQVQNLKSPTPPPPSTPVLLPKDDTAVELETPQQVQKPRSPTPSPPPLLPPLPSLSAEDALLLSCVAYLRTNLWLRLQTAFWVHHTGFYAPLADYRTFYGSYLDKANMPAWEHDAFAETDLTPVRGGYEARLDNDRRLAASKRGGVWALRVMHRGERYWRGSREVRKFYLDAVKACWAGVAKSMKRPGEEKALQGRFEQLAREGRVVPVAGDAQTPVGIEGGGSVENSVDVDATDATARGVFARVLTGRASGAVNRLGQAMGK